MKNSEKEAIETAILWNEEGFNKRDRKISVDLMHFPHVRLWNNQFSIFNSEEEFLKGFDQQTQKLEQEGWTHTVTKILNQSNLMNPKFTYYFYNLDETKMTLKLKIFKHYGL